MADLHLRARTLPAEEWEDALRGTGLEGRTLNPQCSRVIVVELAGRVVACLAVLTLVHAEGLWEAPQVRGHAGVSRALLDALAHLLVAEGVPEVLSQSESPEADDLFEKVGGTRIPGTCWVIPVIAPKESV